MSVLTSLGITVGFHRLFTHRSFETNRVVQCILGILGSMAVQGPLAQWVAVHRRHHQHSDEEGDPHSPHLGRKGFLGFLGRFWHAHVGWLFQRDPPGLEHYVKDINQSPLLRTVSVLFPLWLVLGLAIPAVLGGWLTGTWLGALLGFLWGGLVRIFLCHHVTWSINSVCHLWGQRPFASHDQSRNNVLFGVLGLGEGWHNNHHAFPTSARHGLRWWQVDVSYWVIRGLAFLRLAWNVRVPPNWALLAPTRTGGNRHQTIPERKKTMWNLLVFAVIGLIAGAAARLFYPGREPLRIFGTMLLGMVGALVGGLISWMIWRRVEDEFHTGSLVLSLLGAMLMIAAAAALVYGRNISGARSSSR